MRDNPQAAERHQPTNYGPARARLPMRSSQSWAAFGRASPVPASRRKRKVDRLNDIIYVPPSALVLGVGAAAARWAVALTQRPGRNQARPGSGAAVAPRFCAQAGASDRAAPAANASAPRTASSRVGRSLRIPVAMSGALPVGVAHRGRARCDHARSRRGDGCPGNTARSARLVGGTDLP